MQDGSQIAWVDAAREGNAAAYSRLVSRHYKTVWGLAYSVVGDPTAAEDIAQDTFLTAWTNLGKLRASGAFPMWIRKIARNLAKNWLRSKGYRQRLAERYGSEEQAAAESANEESVRRERRELIRTALNTLSPRIREVMVLFYLEEQSINEVAAALNISEQAVKSRLFQGRNKLRSAVLDQWESVLQDDFNVVDHKPAVDRISAGLALGPAMPSLAEKAAGGSVSLWLHHLLHEGALDTVQSVIWGTTLLTGKKTAAGLGLILLAGLGGWYVASSPNGAKEADAPMEQVHANNFSQPNSPSEELDGGFDAADPGSAGDSTGTNETAAAAGRQRNQAGPNTSGAVVPSYIADLASKGGIEDPEHYAAVRGRVMDEQGNPIPGVVVNTIIAGPAGANEGDSSYLYETVTLIGNEQRRYQGTSQADGSYAIDDIAIEGTAWFAPVKAGYHPVRGGLAKFIPVQKGDVLTGVDFIMSHGVTLTGRVLDESGRPIRDAVVILVGFQFDDSRSRGRLGLTYTNEDGAFLMGFERPGLAALHVDSKTHGQTTFAGIEVFDGANTELIMAAPARLRGRITMANGQPAQDLWVELQGRWRDFDETVQSETRAYRGVTDGRGDYEIAGIDPALDYNAVLRMDDGAVLTAPVPLGSFEPGGERIWDYTLGDGVRITGIVYGQNTGQPLRDVFVALRRADSLEILYEVPVEDDGEYAINVQEGAGNYIIFAKFREIDPNAYGYPSAQELVLETSTPVERDLSMIDPVVRSIQVVDENGVPIEGAQVGTREEDTSAMPIGYTVASGRFDYGGFLPLVESQFVVETQDARRGGSRPSTAQPGDVFPEEIVVMYPNSGLEGVALDDSGNALAYQEIQIIIAYDDGHAVRHSDITDERGYFAILDGIPATSINVVVRTYTDDNRMQRAWHGDAVDAVANTVVNLGEMTLTPDTTDFNGPPAPEPVYPELVQ